MTRATSRLSADLASTPVRLADPAFRPNTPHAPTIPTATRQMPPPDGPLARARPPGRERILGAIRSEAIAARAGLTKPQLHCYITGKEALYEELLMQCLHDWKVTFAFEGPADEPATVLADCVRKKLAHAFDAPEISRIFTREVLEWCSTWRRTRRSTGR